MYFSIVQVIEKSKSLANFFKERLALTLIHKRITTKVVLLVSRVIGCYTGGVINVKRGKLRM